MNKSTTSIFIIIFIFIAGCNKKVCPSKDVYNGLYNALTCDYEQRISLLSHNASNEELKSLKLFTAYQELMAQVTNREEELSTYKVNIYKADNILSEIETSIEQIDTKQNTKTLLRKIRYQVITMRNNINTHQPKFSNEDIHFTKKHLEPQQVTEKNLHQAYKKSYQDSLNVQKNIHHNLNESIKIILMSEKENRLKDKNKEKLSMVLKETKRYLSTIIKK